jgi:hypothetical protein
MSARSERQERRALLVNGGLEEKSRMAKTSVGASQKRRKARKTTTFRERQGARAQGMAHAPLQDAEVEEQLTIARHRTDQHHPHTPDRRWGRRARAACRNAAQLSRDHLGRAVAGTADLAGGRGAARVARGDWCAAHAAIAPVGRLPSRPGSRRDHMGGALSC